MKGAIPENMMREISKIDKITNLKFVSLNFIIVNF